jgi:AcrR family transcriptional regulator
LNRLFVKVIGVTAREYRLGRRQAAADRTRSRILAAARELVSELGPESSLGRVAARAGVSRITIYNQFGTKAGLLEALSTQARPPAGDVPRGETGVDASDELRLRIKQACAAWAVDPRLNRRLTGRTDAERSDDDHALAERLAAQDRLRPGCSIKEAEDVIGILTSFPAFDRLHKEGRRSPSAVAEILLRMSSAIMLARAQG